MTEHDPVTTLRALLATPDECADDARRGHRVTQPGHPRRQRHVRRLMLASVAWHKWHELEQHAAPVVRVKRSRAAKVLRKLLPFRRDEVA